MDKQPQNPKRGRWHATSAWRGYRIAANAVAGASDCGMAADSPAPTDKVKAELDRVRREVLRPAGIVSRLRYDRSSNVFMAKRWITVASEDWPRAAQLVADWLHEHDHELHYVHDASLADVGVLASKERSALELVAGRA